MVSISLLIVSFSCFAAQNPANDPYWEVASKRAEKIVSSLALSDTGKVERIKILVASHYKGLHDIHAERDEKFKEAGILATARSNPGAKPIVEQFQPRILKLHNDLVTGLKINLDPAQVDKIKDGMTYGVVQATYKVYLEYLPQLTEDQKAKIMQWLIEARELALDEGSSEDKHAMFKVYKGKINNYLAQQGYDLRKAEKELQEKRRKEKK